MNQAITPTVVHATTRRWSRPSNILVGTTLAFTLLHTLWSMLTPPPWWLDSGLPEMVFATMGVIFAARGWRANAASERLISRILVLYGTTLIVSNALNWLPQITDNSWLSLLQDTSYFAGYLFLMYLIERLSLKQSSNTHLTHWLSASSGPLLLAGLFVYWILVPLFGAPSVYQSWLPSFLFYLCGDFLLLLMAMRLIPHAETREERRFYGLLLAVLAAWLVSDLAEFGYTSGRFSVAIKIWPPLWWLPAWLFAWLALFVPSRLTCTQASTHPSVAFWRVPAIAAMVLPAIHTLGYGFGRFAPNLLQARSVTVFVMLLAFVGFIVRQLHSLPSRAQHTPPPSTPSPANVEASATQLEQQIREIVNMHLADPQLAPSTIARALGMSERKLQRLCANRLGESPGQLIRRLRLNHAAELLAQGLKATEVAHSVGFSSASYFSRCFRQQYGLTPSAYRSHMCTPH